MRKWSKRRRARAPGTDPPAPPPSRRRRLYSGRKDEHAHDAPWSAERRDWSSLPRDVLWVILTLLPQADILRGAGLVCASWRRVTLHGDEPFLWRHIDLADENGDPPVGWRTTARAAVRCSAGRCESFRGLVDSEFLLFLAESAPSLRSLHVTCTYHIYSHEFITMLAKKLPLLEQVVLSRGLFDLKAVLALITCSPRLHRLDAGGCFTDSTYHVTLRNLLNRKVKDLRLPHPANWIVDHNE